MLKNVFVVFLVFSFVLSFGGQALASNGSFTIAQGADAVTLDPHGQNDQPSSRVRSQIYETLVRQDTDLNLIPGLATDWEQIDELTWEFTLREDVYFHNGELFTADDAVFTLERLADPATAAPGAFIVGFMESVEAVDENTIHIHTDSPFAPMLNHLAHPVTGMLNRQAVEEAGDDYGTQVVIGTGPFEFVRWSTGSEIELKRFEDYWGENALPERIVFRNIPENTVRAIEVETGGIDIGYNIDPIDEARIRDGEMTKLTKHDTLATHYIGFNVQKAPFDDLRVRQAINHAVDVEAIVDYVYTGQAVRATSPISDTVWGANLDLNPYSYDPELAQELLAEAGYPDGFSASVWTNDNPLRMQIAELVQSDLRNIGVDISVEILEWGQYLEDTGMGRHDMFILGWVAVTGDADYGLYSLFHSTQFGDAGNRTFWSQPRVDELLDLARSDADPEVRREAYHEAQQLIAEDAPWVFLIHTQEANGLRSDVEGFIPHPAGHHDLRNLTRVS